MVVDPRLSPPALFRALLVRGRLLTVLRGRWDRRVTALVAGGGFGKTALLTQAVAENDLDPLGLDCWVSCKPADALTSVFAEALCTALGAPQCGDDPPAVAAELLAGAIAQRAPSLVSLVLDDAHALGDGSMGAALLNRLVELLPANGHVVIASRGWLPSGVARLVAQGAAAVIDEEAMGFSDEELLAFAALRGVEPHVVAEAGGWPTLAELAASTGQPLRREFLWDEVLALLSSEQRHALTVLVAIGGGDDESLSAARGVAVEPGVIQRLVDEVPLLALTADGWCVPHDLWEPALHDQLGADERRDAFRGAGLVASQRGDLQRAFQLLADAEAWDEITALIRRACAITHVAVPLDVVDAWLQRLPEALRSSPEGLLLIGVATKEHDSDPRAAVASLEAAASGFNARGDLLGELACLPHLAQIAYWLGDAELMSSSLLRALAVGEDGEPDSPFVALARAQLDDFSGDHRGALRDLDRAQASPLHGGWTPWAYWARAETLISLGRPDEAVAAADAGCAHAGTIMRGVVEDTRLLALWLAGHVDTVLADLDIAVDLQDAAGGIQQRQAALLHASRFAAFVGQQEDARTYLERSNDLGPPSSIPIMARAVLARVACAVAAGDEAEATAMLEATLAEAPLGANISTRAHRRALALSYVLVPATREFWDRDELGPCFVASRSLARAFVAAREGSPSFPIDEALPTPGIVRSSLPLPWAAHLSVAASGNRGAALLDELGQAARPWLTRLTTSQRRPEAASARKLLATVPSMPSERLHVGVLGPLELRRDGALVEGTNLSRERVRQLLGYLVMHRKATRQAITAALWPDLDDDAARNNLRVTLSRLVRSFEPNHREGDASFFVRQDERSLHLNGESHLEVDAWEFERHLDDAALAERHGTPSLALEASLRAIGLWRGPYLVDAGADWAELEAERIRIRFLDAAARAGELLLAAGETDQPERLATQVLELEPWSERAYRLLAATYLERGDRPAARRALDRCTAMLADLGVGPDPETAMLDRHARATGNGDGVMER